MLPLTSASLGWEDWTSSCTYVYALKKEIMLQAKTVPAWQTESVHQHFAIASMVPAIFVLFMLLGSLFDNTLLEMLEISDLVADMAGLSDLADLFGESKGFPLGAAGLTAGLCSEALSSSCSLSLFSVYGPF